MTAADDLYTAAPGGGAAAPGVLLLPAIAGVNEYIRRVAARLSGQGYAVQAVDYHAEAGRPPDLSTPAAILQAVASLSEAAVLEAAARALDGLRRRPGVDSGRIAVLGFCIGGTYAMLSGCTLDGVAAVVNYYGSVRNAADGKGNGIAPLERVAQLRAPLLSHYGTADRFVPAADVDALEHALDAAGRVHEIFRYGGAPHAFDEDFRPAYRPVAAQEAWARTLNFINWYTRNPK